MSTAVTVVLVVVGCWFGVALVAGLVLGNFLRRADTLAVAYEREQTAPQSTTGVSAGVPVGTRTVLPKALRTHSR